MSQAVLQVADWLQELISSSGASDGAEVCRKLLSAESMQMISEALGVIEASKSQDALSGIVDKLSSVLMLANDSGKEVKNHLVTSLLETFIGFIINSDVLVEYRLEILKNINIILENCSISSREKLLSKEEFVNKLSSLFDAILHAGDYEFQVCIIECLFRFIPKSRRADVTKKAVKENTFLSEQFLSIRYSHFETDCRRVLNKLNNQNTSGSTRVFSFPAESVKIDGEKIYKPSDEDYDQFWIDFNAGSGRIGFFIEPNFVQSQSQGGETMWETVSLWKYDVEKCHCIAQGSFWKGVIELKPGALIYSSREPDDQSHLVVIFVSSMFPLQDALLETFVDTDINVGKQQKSSLVANPVSVSIPMPVSKKTLKNKSGLESAVAKAISSQLSQKSSDSVCISSQQSTSHRCGAKTSVPMIPMRNPANSVISSSNPEEIAWHQTHVRMSKANVSDRNSQEMLRQNSFKRQEGPVGAGQMKAVQKNKASVSISSIAKGAGLETKHLNQNGTKTSAQITEVKTTEGSSVKDMPCVAHERDEKTTTRLSGKEQNTTCMKEVSMDKPIKTFSDVKVDERIPQKSLSVDEVTLAEIHTKKLTPEANSVKEIPQRPSSKEQISLPEKKLRMNKPSLKVSASETKVDKKTPQKSCGKRKKSSPAAETSFDKSNQSISTSEANESVSLPATLNEDNISCSGVRRSQRNSNKHQSSGADQSRSKQEDPGKLKPERKKDSDDKKCGKFKDGMSKDEAKTENAFSYKSGATDDRMANDSVCKSTKEPKTPPAKSQRTEKVKTPVVTIQAHRKSRNGSTSDIDQGEKGKRATRGKDVKGQTSGEKLDKASKSQPTRPNLFSPGNVSEEDFKMSKPSSSLTKILKDQKVNPQGKKSRSRQKTVNKEASSGASVTTHKLKEDKQTMEVGKVVTTDKKLEGKKFTATEGKAFGKEIEKCSDKKQNESDMCSDKKPNKYEKSTDKKRSPENSDTFTKPDRCSGQGDVSDQDIEGKGIELDNAPSETKEKDDYPEQRRRYEREASLLNNTNCVKRKRALFQPPSQVKGNDSMLAQTQPRPQKEKGSRITAKCPDKSSGKDDSTCSKESARDSDVSVETHSDAEDNLKKKGRIPDSVEELLTKGHNTTEGKGKNSRKVNSASKSTCENEAPSPQLKKKVNSLSKDTCENKAFSPQLEKKVNNSSKNTCKNETLSPQLKNAEQCAEDTHASTKSAESFPGDDASSSSSGFLYIETDCGAPGSQDGVVVETQREKLTPKSQHSENFSPNTHKRGDCSLSQAEDKTDCSFSKDVNEMDCSLSKSQGDIDISSPIGPTQMPVKSKSNKAHRIHLMNESKLSTYNFFEEDKLNASGDYNLPSAEPQISSNMESSYVFSKFGCATDSRNNVADLVTTESLLINREETLGNFKESGPKKAGAKAEKEKTSRLLNHSKGKEVADINGKTNEAIALPTLGCGDGQNVTHESNLEAEKCGQQSRQLRERKKKISYKEWESFDANFDDKITPGKHHSMKHSTPFDSKTKSNRLDRFSIESPSEDKCRTQDDRLAMKLYGSMAPKKIPKESRMPKKTFWTSQEVKTTVTTTSFSKLIESSPSDPYSFDAECAATTTEMAPFIPFRSYSYNRSNQDLSPSDEPGSVQAEKEKTFKPSYKNVDLCSRDYVAQKKKTLHQRTFSEFNNNESTISKMLKTSCAQKSKVMANKKRQKKTERKESMEITLFSSQKSAARENERSGQIRESTEFALYASQRSQIEASKSQSGLVFPPLEDSIPCTPYKDHEDEPSDGGLEISGRKSAVSDLSWIKKSKTPAVAQKKMRGKTYNKKAMKHSAYQADSDESDAQDQMEYGPLYQHLYEKQHNKTEAVRGGRMAKTSPRTPKRRKVLGTLEMEATPGRSPGLSKFRGKNGSITNKEQGDNNEEELDEIDIESDLDNKCVSDDKVKKNIHPSNKMLEAIAGSRTPKKKQNLFEEDRVISSILTSSTKKAGDTPKMRPHKSLSFKSPSDHGTLSADEPLDCEDEVGSPWYPKEKPPKSLGLRDISNVGKTREGQVISKCKSPAKGTKSIEEEESIGSMGKRSRESWHMLSLQLEDQIQGVFDKVSDCLDESDESCSKKIVGLHSGLSSEQRPRRSELKRKYAGLGTSSSDHEDASDVDGNGSKRMLLPKSSPGITLGHKKSKCKTPKTPKKKLSAVSPFDEYSPSLRKSALKKPAHHAQPDLNSPKRKKRRSQRKLQLSPEMPVEDEFCCKSTSTATRSLISFNLSPHLITSPERTRDCKKSLSGIGEDLCFPMSVSIGSSPLLGLSQLNSPHFSNEMCESPAGPTALLDSIKDDLKKPLGSQHSDGSSEDYLSQLPDSTETGSNGLNPTEVPYGSLRDFLTKKNMIKKPSLIGEMENVTKPTIKCITSRWDDEHQKRMTAVSKFQSITENVLAAMSRDVKEINEFEKTAVQLWEQQRERLRRHTHKQEKEMKKLKEAHEDLREQLQETQTYSSSAQKAVRSVLKKDVEAFKRKLVEKYNEHSLEAMKRCLQASFMF